MRLHMATDTGKDLTKKVGLVYQLNIAPKVSHPSSPSPSSSPSQISRESLLFYLTILRETPTRSTGFLIREFMCGAVHCRSSAVTRRSSWATLRRARSPKVYHFASSFAGSVF